jgi:hypothetical protein
MLEKDVKIGDRVVPFQKTRQPNIINWTKFLEYGSDTSKFFKENGYLIVRKIYQDYFSLGNGTDKCDKFEFNASDFEPYEEPVEDNGIKKMLTRGNRTIVFLKGSRKGVSVCSPSDTFDPVKGVALAYARALGQTVDDIEIVVNPAQNAPQEDKPLTFEVGEMVKFREDLIDGKTYDHMTYYDSMKNNLPKTFALPEINAVRNCHLDSWHFPLCMLEKVPQVKHEVIIDGVKYVKEP